MCQSNIARQTSRENTAKTQKYYIESSAYQNREALERYVFKGGALRLEFQKDCMRQFQYQVTPSIRRSSLQWADGFLIQLTEGVCRKASRTLHYCINIVILACGCTRCCRW